MEISRSEEKDMDIAYDVVEEMPAFPGGMSALMDFYSEESEL